MGQAVQLGIQTCTPPSTCGIEDPSTIVEKEGEARLNANADAESHSYQTPQYLD
jgi:hypothetical protein